MITLPLLAALLAAPAAPSPYALRWGVLAQMTGGDHIAISKAKVAGIAYRVEWVREGEELRFVEVMGVNRIIDCRITIDRPTGKLPASCVLGKSTELRGEMQVAVNGAATIVYRQSDWLTGETKSTGPTIRPTSTPGVLEWKEGFSTLTIVPADDPRIVYPKFFGSIPKALAQIGHVAKVTPPPAAPAASAAPSTSEPPL